MNETTRRTFLRNSGGMAALALMPKFGLAGPSSLDLEVAVIGAGRQGRAILAELLKFEGVCLGAICDVDERRLESGARRAKDARTYTDHRELFSAESGVKAVIVATPTHLHAAIAQEALKAGKHVYCEAPLASTIEDCAAVLEAAERSDRVFQTGMQGRSNPIYKLANSFARAGAIRDLVSLRAQYHKKTSWRTPADDPARDKALNWRLDPEVSLGLAGEFGTQQFDVIHWFADRYPKSVRGSGSVRLHQDGREVADSVRCDLDFGEGLDLAYEATLANSFEGQYELLCGTMGTIKLAWTAGWLFKEADAVTQGWEVYANRVQFHNEEGITLIADATKLAKQGKLQEGVGLPNPPLYYALSDFLRSVADSAPVACSAREGARAAAVGIAAARAVASAAEVEVDTTFF
ncbi:MAG: Gfo/Idh/MocA family oxidoreductase [Planctomycetota bacterium]